MWLIRWRRHRLPSNLRLKRAMRHLNSIVDGFIQQGRAQKAPTDNLLSRLLHAQDEDGSRMTAKQLRDRIGGPAQIEGTDNLGAAAQCEVAVLTVPFSGQAALLKQLKSVWKPGTIVIDPPESTV